MYEYFTYLGRLNLFSNSFIANDIELLALMGFKPTQNRDTVQCVYCGVRVKGWRGSDIPVLKHYYENPNCPFIKSVLKYEENFNETTFLMQGTLVFNPKTKFYEFVL